MTDEFVGFARELLGQRNAGSLPLAVVEHPVGGIRSQQAAARVTDEVISAVVAALQDQQQENES